MTSDERLATALGRDELPPTFDRWRLVLAPGTERPTEAAEWAGALVRVESGTLDVDCLAGGHRTFGAGALLVLGWLPLRSLRNHGTDEVRLVAVRRRGPPPRARYLYVVPAGPAGDGRRDAMGLPCDR